MIKCEIELDFSWVKSSIISEISITPPVPVDQDDNPSVPDVAPIKTTGATFHINNATNYVPIVTFSSNNIHFF